MSESLKPTTTVCGVMSEDTEPLRERLNEIASQRQADTVLEFGLGGRFQFLPKDFEMTENRRAGEEANPAKPIIHETDNPTEYITVHYQNGNYEWFEFDFRIRGETAYLASRTRISHPKNGHGWVPPEVEEVITEHHPNLEVSNEKPPDWEE